MSCCLSSRPPVTDMLCWLCYGVCLLRLSSTTRDPNWFYLLELSLHTLVGSPELLGGIALERGMYSGVEAGGERHRAVVGLARPQEPGKCRLCSFDFLLWLWDTTDVHRDNKSVRDIPPALGWIQTPAGRLLQLLSRHRARESRGLQAGPVSIEQAGPGD